MRVRFRLNQLLTRQGHTGHGRISFVAAGTGLERHRVAKLLDENVDKISLEALSSICRFLIERCGVDPRELPGALFEIEPNRFLTLLRQTPTLRTCFGVRQRRPESNVPWTAGADSFLHGKFLELLLRAEEQPRLPTAGDAQPLPADSPGGGSLPAAMTQGRFRVCTEIRHFHQEQVPATYGPLPDDPAARETELQFLRQQGERVDRILHELAPGRVTMNPEAQVRQVALVLGSVKSNPVCEFGLARLFKAAAWESHGRTVAEAARARGGATLAAKPSDRAVPFYIRYRTLANAVDPLIPSCHAGI